ncbi:MAG: preprotein translocase subunit SecE [Acidobacteriota bacterium]
MNWWKKLVTFSAEVKTELKKSTWPGWNEVKGTTVVVIVTSFIFAFFLWVVDIVFQQVLGGIMHFFTT